MVVETSIKQNERSKVSCSFDLEEVRHKSKR